MISQDSEAQGSLDQYVTSHFNLRHEMPEGLAYDSLSSKDCWFGCLLKDSVICDKSDMQQF